MEHPRLSPRTLVSDLPASSTLTAKALLTLQVDCVGCSMKKFCTLEDVSRYYGLGMKVIINTLKEHLEGSEKQKGLTETINQQS